MSSGASFAERIVAFVAVEAVLTSGSVYAMNSLRTRRILPGLTIAHALILTDQAFHAKFACLLERLLQQQLPDGVAHEIFLGAVHVEKEFIHDSLPRNVPHLSLERIERYVEFVANKTLSGLGHSTFSENVGEYHACW